VAGLLKAGFEGRQITVICSDEATDEHFKDCQHLRPAGANAPKAILRGGEVGAALGGAIALAGGAFGIGAEAIAMMPIVVPAGAIFGGMVGGMMLEGTEKELAEFYHLAVADGNILLAVEDRSERHEQMLAEAERVFTDCGAHPFGLDEE
jgi:hypothetical protein